jgi:hypothetical protein
MLPLKELLSGFSELKKRGGCKTAALRLPAGLFVAAKRCRSSKPSLYLPLRYLLSVVLDRFNARKSRIELIFTELPVKWYINQWFMVFFGIIFVIIVDNKNH